MASKNSSGATYGKGRTRNFATVVYPDSAPEDWQEILAQQFVPCFISPLHDKDINPTGELKKPHYHVLIAYDTVKTIEQAKAFVELINGVGCEVVNSLRGYARYLCHLDNPEKAQYSQDDVRTMCGADFASVIGLATDKYKALGEMQDFCEHYNVVSFYALARYARVHRQDWHRILCDCGSVFMREYLQSRRWSKEQNCGDIVDPETGEVIETPTESPEKRPQSDLPKTDDALRIEIVREACEACRGENSARPSYYEVHSQADYVELDPDEELPF